MPRNDSKLLGATGAMVRESLVGQPIQLARRRIFFELLVPRSRIKRRKPFPKGGELFGREAADVAFELLDLSHALEYKRTLIVRLTNRA